MAWGIVAKSAWSDKFRMPSVDELRAGMASGLRPVLEEARQRLTEVEGVSETLIWQGVPWRWTLVYLGADRSEGRAIAYVIPDPNRLQICIPLAQEQIERLPLKRMKKSIRDGVVHARNVAGVWWPTWDVPSRVALDEVFDLVVRKQKLAAGEPAGAGA